MTSVVIVLVVQTLVVFVNSEASTVETISAIVDVDSLAVIVVVSSTCVIIVSEIISWEGYVVIDEDSVVGEESVIVDVGDLISDAIARPG